MVNQPSEPRLIVTSESGQDVSRMQKWLDGTGSDPDPGNPHDLATAPLTPGGAQ